MRTELFWLLSFCGFAALSLVCGLVAWPQLAAAWPVIEEQIDRFRRLHPLAKVALLVFVAGFIAYGSTKTNQVGQVSGTNGVEIVEGGDTNAPPMMLMMAMPSFGDESPTVTPEDVARLWQLSEVRTNLNICYTMPEGAMMASNWWVRGAYEDVVRVPGSEFQVPSFRFPYGSNEHCSAWAFAWGKVRFALADTNTEIVAVGAPMSAVPYRSRLWAATDTNGSWLVTWEDFALNRDTGTPVNAQIELRANGDFITRSSEVESVHQRLNPEDWDGDGWENGDDPNPRVWDEFYDDFWQELPEGANEAAYCWIEIRPRWHSYIEFAGDGPSDLDDPYLWAKAGETYRVQLLIGKTYDVESTQPFDIVAKSDERIEVTGYGINQVEIVWPVTFTVAEGRAPTGRPRLGATLNDGGKSFYVMPNPPWLCGVVTWTDNYCCDVWGDGTNFTYACDNTCTCEGCTVYGNYWYEGYALPVWGLECGCHYIEDHGPTEMSLTFDKSAAIYEDDYTNRPGVVVHPTPSNVVLRCEVYGGTYGGRLTVSLNEAGYRKIARVSGDALPNNVLIQPDTTRVFETVYTPLEPSDRVNDIVATATYVEDFTHDAYAPQTATLTSVKVELAPRYLAPNNDSVHRHIVGVDEYVDSNCTPSDVTFQWVDDVDVDVDLNETSFWSPWTGGKYHPTLYVQGAPYQTTLDVFEPSVVCMAAWWNGELGTNGIAGNVEMDLALFVEPSFVSFKDLNIQEIPDNVPHSHWGYFNDQSKGGSWSHTSAAGAGRWHPVLDYGFWTFDAVGVRSYPEPWSDGYKVWDIPVGWGDGSVLRGRVVPNPTRQEFWIDSDGTVTIRKYQHEIMRMIYGHVFFDGNLVN